MAKEQNRGNREPKKPKATKKPAASSGTSVQPPARPLPAKGGGKQ